MGQGYRCIVDVHLLLIQGGQMLLGERQDTGYEDGKYHLPAGHLEDGYFPRLLRHHRGDRSKVWSHDDLHERYL